MKSPAVTGEFSVCVCWVFFLHWCCQCLITSPLLYLLFFFKTSLPHYLIWQYFKLVFFQPAYVVFTATTLFCIICISIRLKISRRGGLRAHSHSFWQHSPLDSCAIFSWPSSRWFWKRCTDPETASCSREYLSLWRQWFVTVITMEVKLMFGTKTLNYILHLGVVEAAWWLRLQYPLYFCPQLPVYALGVY